jgi:hypothetical protein
MRVNFEIANNTSLIVDGHTIDLHNNFNMVGYSFDLARRTLVIEFSKAAGQWVAEDEYASVRIIHTDVFFYNIGYDNEVYEFPDDDKTVSAISFVPSADRESNQEIFSNGSPREGDDILFIFETDHFLRVGCGAVEVATD